MAMTGARACRWVQTLGPRVEARALAWCPQRWTCIEERLKGMAKLMTRLCVGAVCPSVPELRNMQRAGWEAAPPWPESAASPCHSGRKEKNDASPEIVDKSNMEEPRTPAHDVIESTEELHPCEQPVVARVAVN